MMTKRRAMMSDYFRYDKDGKKIPIVVDENVYVYDSWLKARVHWAWLWLKHLLRRNHG